MEHSRRRDVERARRLSEKNAGTFVGGIGACGGNASAKLFFWDLRRPRQPSLSAFALVLWHAFVNAVVEC